MTFFKMTVLAMTLTLGVQAFAQTPNHPAYFAEGLTGSHQSRLDRDPGRAKNRGHVRSRRHTHRYSREKRAHTKRLRESARN